MIQIIADACCQRPEGIKVQFDILHLLISKTLITCTIAPLSSGIARKMQSVILKGLAVGSILKVRLIKNSLPLTVPPFFKMFSRNLVSDSALIDLAKLSKGMVKAPKIEAAKILIAGRLFMGLI